ncbi:MAG: hypothetical protein HGA54_05505, partial [Actinobacteria bacterium]|nr:hypothetical protein [Actinomycetota bacterium]
MSLIEIDVIDEEKDNGLVDPAITDASITEAELSLPELSFQEKLFILETAVTRHALNREILYNILACCKEESTLEEIEHVVSSCPEFKSATQSPYQSIKILKRSYGLDLIERDAEGGVVVAEQKIGLTEDEIDDLICSLSYITTEVGNYFVELHRPKARLIELLNLVPERTDTYTELLEYVNEAPNSYKEIEALLTDRPVLEIVID